MSNIENPWHSRPIDVHRWSDHPEVKQFVDRIWDEHLPAEMVGKSGPKPKMAFRKQLRVLILDLSKKMIEIINALQEAGLSVADSQRHYSEHRPQMDVSLVCSDPS